jgi:methyl-accepting chemotaxis protein
MKMSFGAKLVTGFVVCSFGIALVTFLFDFYSYFGLADSFNSRLAVVGICSIIFGLIFGKVYGSYVAHSIRKLKQATSVISRGDLRQKVEIGSHDDLGAMGESFNHMVESLVQTIQEVKSVSDTIYDSAMNLSATSQEMNASTLEISTTVQSIANGARIQAQMGTQTNGVTKELAESIEIVAQKADSADRLAQEMYSRASEGNQHTLLASERMSEVAGKLDRASGLVQGFRERSLEINNAVRHITSIAQQTHLLALNATIEAARAGDHGRGFAVVAEEVRKLSQDTRKLAEQISGLADAINLGSQEVLTSISDSSQSASQGRETMRFANRSLQEIVDSVQASLNQVQEITRLTREQTLSAARLVEAIEEIARIAEQNAEGTHEAHAAAQQQTAAMEELAASAQELSRTSDRLKSSVAAFQY